MGNIKEPKVKHWTIRKNYERESIVKDLLEKLSKEYKIEKDFTKLVFDLIEIAYHNPAIFIQNQSTTDLEELNERIFEKQNEEKEEILNKISNVEKKLDRLLKMNEKEEDSFLIEEDK